VTSRDAVAALMTPPGRGAIATIRVSVDWGSWAPLDTLAFRAANGRPLNGQSVGRVVFGSWGTDSIEQVVVCPISEQSLEIHCHGGIAAARRILRDLANAGCRMIEWTEALASDSTPLYAEISGALSRATTLRTAAILWEQADGIFESAVRSLTLSARANVPTATPGIANLLAWSAFGLHLTRPWRVVLAGRPNVGKSSLANSLLGYTRALVFDQPGTTRDVVSASAAIDGWPIELFDTAGLRESDDPLEAAGIEQARHATQSADLVLVLIDVSQPASQSDRAILARHPKAIVVAHKCDLSSYDGADRWSPVERETWIPASSKNTAGIDVLAIEIAKRLVPHVPPTATPIPTTERQIGLLERALSAAERFDRVATLEALEELIAGVDPQ
jgi:tRNA modification GTPase